MTVESPNGQQLQSETGGPLDALAYLDVVKNQFQDNADVYSQFLGIMKDFMSQAIDTPSVIQRVSSLFDGYPALIAGFNTFLPVGCRIDDPNAIDITTPSATTIQMTNGFNHATQYVDKIKARYALRDDPNTYKQFLDILQTYHKEQINSQEAYEQVQMLFVDAPDLLAEFKDFLPDVPPIPPTVAQPVESSGPSTLHAVVD